MKRETTKRAQLLDERSSSRAGESGLDSMTKLIHIHKMAVDGSLNHQDGLKCRTRGLVKLETLRLDNLAINVNPTLSNVELADCQQKSITLKLTSRVEES